MEKLILPHGRRYMFSYYQDVLKVFIVILSSGILTLTLRSTLTASLKMQNLGIHKST